MQSLVVLLLIALLCLIKAADITLDEGVMVRINHYSSNQ